MNRVVCWFSCGAASAVATKLAIQKYSLLWDVVVVRCIVKEEHADNDRFAADCEKWFGQPIVNIQNDEFGASVMKVIEKRKYIAGVRGAPCTMLLKKQMRESFQKPDDLHVFGYCAEEEARWDRFLDANNIQAEAPLMDRCLSHADTLGMLQNAGIELPVMYRLGYQHNNCIGCVKATGQGYWNKIRIDFPNQFWQMAGASRALGVKMVEASGKRIYLDELEPGTGRYQDEPEIQCGIFCEMAEREMAV